MIKNSMILFICLSMLTSLHAQPGPPDDEKIKSLRVAFLTNYLDLSVDESQKFWPIFNKMDADMDKLLSDYDMRRGKSPDFDNMSETELNNFILKQFEFEQKMLDLKKRYSDEYKKALPLKKVAMLGEAEQAFKRELMKAAREKRGGPDGPPPAGGNFPNP